MYMKSVTVSIERVPFVPWCSGSSVKCRATKLCSEYESELRNLLQGPLLVYAQWSYKVSEVLASSSDVADFSRVAVTVRTIEVRTLAVLPSVPLWQVSSHQLRRFTILESLSSIRVEQFSVFVELCCLSCDVAVNLWIILPWCSCSCLSACCRNVSGCKKVWLGSRRRWT